MSQYIVAFLIAFGISFCLTPLIKRFAIQVGAVDAPDARKVHSGLVPRLGGLAIFIGYIISLLYSVEVDTQIQLLALGTTILVGIGIWDDIKQIGPKTKLVGQIAAAAVVVLGGVNIAYLSNPWGDLIILPAWFSIPFTIFWIVAFTNMVNLIDGLDGLAAGISLIACTTIFAVAVMTGQVETATITIALAGAILAFLKYNFNPAKIFMGDTGSMLLGYTLGVISVIGLVKTAATIALVVPVVALGVPILDTAFAIIRRYMNDRPVFKPDKGHLHHRLLAMGLNQKQAVLLMYAVTAYFGVLAMIMAEYSFIVGMTMMMVSLVAGVYMAYRIGVIGKER